jgi:hypothetical protein
MQSVHVVPPRATTTGPESSYEQPLLFNPWPRGEAKGFALAVAFPVAESASKMLIMEDRMTAEKMATLSLRGPVAIIAVGGAA